MGWTSRPSLRPTTWPWWVQVLAVFALTRAVSTAVLLQSAAGQPDSYWGPGPPDYATFVGTFWDGSWYREIAEDGYPDGLPLDPGGAVLQNRWAFFPLFPILVRPLLALGASWDVAAPTLALLLAAAAMLVIDRLVQRGVDLRRDAGPGAGTPVGAAPDTVPGGPSSRRLALGTVLLVGLYPAAPVLQVAYTESLSLLLVAVSLWLLAGRSYVAAAPVVVALGLTRAVALPVALVVAVHLAQRALAHRRGTDPFPRGDVVRVLALGALAAAAGVLWPVWVGLSTGVPDAYLRTQAAWRGSFSSAPVVPWVEMSGYLLGSWGLPVLVLAVVAVLGLALSRGAGAAGVEVRAWGVAYPLWLLVVAFPQTSLIRFLLLAFPLGLATVALARSRWVLGTVALAFAAGQVVWVRWLWQLTEPTAWPP